MQTVILSRNAFDYKSYETYEVEDVRVFCKEQFAEWPTTARIFHNYVAKGYDVTPHTEIEIERLGKLEGKLYVIVFPQGIEWIIIAIVAVIAVAATVYLLTQKVPVAPGGQQSPSSPNNSLTGRQNQARPLGRIPDIFGEVISTPDLLALPYKIYDAGVEVEVAYMCVGRGEYDVSEIKDGDTLVSEIDGVSVEVYAPDTSPNLGVPTTTIGDAITNTLLDVASVTGVNGQILVEPNAGSFAWLGNNCYAKAQSGGWFIARDTGASIDWRNLWAPGDLVNISIFAPNNPFASVDLTGQFYVPGTAGRAVPGGGPAVGKHSMWLYQPDTVNPNWTAVVATTADAPLTIGTVSGTKYAGPFTVKKTGLTQLICNFVALGGLYTIDTSGLQDSLDIDVEIECTPVNSSGLPTGVAEIFTGTLSGSSIGSGTVGITVFCTLAVPGSLYSVRTRRTTNRDYTFSGQVVDEIKWRDCYAASPVTATDFGNVTTVYARTRATEGALKVAERKLNLRATRKVPIRIAGSTFGATAATQSADEIISAICLDPYLGNRAVSEIDFDNIYTTVAAVKAYFGTAEAGTFNFTFDGDNNSFEETIAAIADAVFCQAYRRGNLVKLFFEKDTPDSTLLFNHRNKIPSSENRSIGFGNQGNYDGVWFDYISDEDGAKITLYIPADRSSVNPKKVTSVGVTSDLQAYFKAWRLWNKIRYQNLAVTFDATQEADVSIITERILVADNTRSDTQDGEIVAQSGLEISLSQAVDLTGDTWTIFIQHYDGTIESMGVTAGSTTRKLMLASVPRLPLSLDEQQYARPTFVIVGSTAARPIACLLTDKTPKDNFTIAVTAANYDSRFYAKDQDHVLGIV